jgi:hypothetical protein
VLRSAWIKKKDVFHSASKLPIIQAGLDYKMTKVRRRVIFSTARKYRREGSLPAVHG